MYKRQVKQITEWNPYDQNSVSSFFDPEWMFCLKEKFDIVIGNPPYISTKGVKEEDKVKYEKEFGFSDDTYNLFTFKGLALCKDGGTLTYITPKTFWTTQTKRNMRDLLLSNTIRYIFDTANPFEAAMVDTCITQTVKQPMVDEHIVDFYDGTADLSHPIEMCIRDRINDARQLPIIIPTSTDDEQAKSFVSNAIKIKKGHTTNNALDVIQKEVDSYVEKIYNL